MRLILETWRYAYCRQFSKWMVNQRPPPHTHTLMPHDDVIKWNHFPRYWPFVRGIHRSPVNSPHKGQWRGALMFSLICARINGWVNNREAGGSRRHRAHYDITVMLTTRNEPKIRSTGSTQFEKLPSTRSEVLMRCPITFLSRGIVSVTALMSCNRVSVSFTNRKLFFCGWPTCDVGHSEK